MWYYNDVVDLYSTVDYMATELIHFWLSSYYLKLQNNVLSKLSKLLTFRFIYLFWRFIRNKIIIGTVKTKVLKLIMQF